MLKILKRTFFLIPLFSACSQILMADDLIVGSQNQDIFINDHQHEGTLSKIGSGTLTLSGTHVGHLMLQEGTLTGLGTIEGDLNVNTRTKIEPCDPFIGTLFVEGNYTQQTDAAYLLPLNRSGESSLISIEGQAFIQKGALHAYTVDEQYAIGKKYLIMQAKDGIKGRFSNVHIDNIYLKPTLHYTANEVILSIQTNFEKLAETGNQKHVAHQLDQIVNPDPHETIIFTNLIQLNKRSFLHTLNQLSGVQYSSLIENSQLSVQRFYQKLANPILYLPQDDCSCGYEIWGDVQGGRGFKHDCYRRSSFDFTLGINKRLSPCLLVGSAAQYEKDFLHYHVGGHAKIHTIQGSLYGIYHPGCYYVTSNLLFGYNHCYLKRSIEFGGIDVHARSHPDIYQTTLYNELGKDFSYRCFTFLPFAGLETGYYHRSHVREKGAAPLNLIIKNRDTYTLSSYLGMRLLAELPWELQMSANLAWQHRFHFAHDRVKAHFANFGSTFSVQNKSLGKNSLEGSFSLGKRLGEHTEVYAECTGELWRRYTSYSVSAGLEWEW